MSVLTANDQYVYSCLFPDADETLETSRGAAPLSACEPLDGSTFYSEADKDPDAGTVDAAEVDIIQRLEAKTVTAAAALVEYDALAKQFPTRASVHNNRAQVRRLLYVEQEEDACRLAAIEKDLDTAIRLAQDDEESGGAGAGAAGRVLAQAYTQKGWLALKRIEALRAREQPQQAESVQQQRCVWDMEEEASRWLWLGGAHGNRQAQRAASRINPYAKLCGQMVEQALRREM